MHFLYCLFIKLIYSKSHYPKLMNYNQPNSNFLSPNILNPIFFSLIHLFSLLKLTCLSHYILIHFLFLIFPDFLFLSNFLVFSFPPAITMFFLFLQKYFVSIFSLNPLIQCYGFQKLLKVPLIIQRLSANLSFYLIISRFCCPQNI